MLRIVACWTDCWSRSFVKVSLVDQDDALFRQLLALNTSIHELRSQQRALTRNNASMSPCSTSMASSLASSTDGEDSDQERSHSPTPLTRHRWDESLSIHYDIIISSWPIIWLYDCDQYNMGLYNIESFSLSSPRKRGEAKRTPSSLASSSPTWSTSSRSSQESNGVGGVVSSKSGVSVKGVPRSPHASFYSRVSIKTPDRLMVVHKRQGSYDSGIQGSEPSDAEVFVWIRPSSMMYIRIECLPYLQHLPRPHSQHPPTTTNYVLLFSFFFFASKFFV